MLKKRLEDAGYFVVYFDAALEIDMNDVDYADILLAMMRQLGLQVRDGSLGLELDAARLEDLAMRLAKVTLEKEDRNENLSKAYPDLPLNILPLTQNLFLPKFQQLASAPFAVCDAAEPPVCRQ
jgi:hypothetical protein